MHTAAQHKRPPNSGLAQADVIAYLSRAASYPQPVNNVSVRQTHAAYIFLAGREAYKIKKAIALPYLNFSTLALRKAVCERELELNQPLAPQIYIDVVAICRTDDGALHIAGPGQPVEWAVHMHRFDDDAVVATAIEQGALEPAFYDALADEIARSHTTAAVAGQADGAAAMDSIITELCDAFAGAGDLISHARLAEFCRHLRQHAEALRHRLDQRGRRGYVRRCHGDLHLGNIVILDGKPVLFDAIEFNEDIATIDILYDLAFLIMDLETRSMRAEANQVLNRYLSIANDTASIAALQALPLFLSCRAAIRAMVKITQMRQTSSARATTGMRKQMLAYFSAASDYLVEACPQLICIGGLSGTGKTTVARRLAPVIGRSPGAVHLRSDVERKRLFDVPETRRLPASAYSADISATIYARLMRKAKLALLTGSSVVMDAVFLKPGERDRAEQIARSCGASFTGLWLQAEERTMVQRVGQRQADASDATAEVVRWQLSKSVGKVRWQKIDAGKSADTAFEQCYRTVQAQH